MTENALFEGNDLTEWLQHFKLLELREVLEDSGVTNVADLANVYGDDELLVKLRERVGVQVFRGFMKARVKTVFPSDSSPSSFKGAGHHEILSSSISIVEDPVRLAAFDQQQDVDAIPVAAVNQLEVDDEKKKGNKRIDVVRSETTPVCSVDLAFLLDCTGGMKCFADFISAIQHCIAYVVNRHPSLKLRIAFVGYRDFDVDEDQLSVHAFTEDASSVCTFLRSQRAMGGGDEAEDVLGGLEEVNKLDWQSKERILYHIADAPCHGAAFHDSKVTDKYATAYGPADYERVLCDLCNKGILYLFGKIKDTTNLMMAKFNQLVNPTRDYILQIPLALNVKLNLPSVIEVVLNVAEKPMFDGFDSPLTSWVQHFSLSSSNLQTVLELEDGVEVVADLIFVYEDDKLLEYIRLQIGVIAFMQFMAARKRTRVLLNLSENGHESYLHVVENESVVGSSLAAAVEQQVGNDVGEQQASTQLMEASVVNEEDSGTAKYEWRSQHVGQDSVDLVFLVDCTGSMGRFITKIKDSIVKFMEDHASLKLRVAFVGYRDFDAGKDCLVVHPFTEDASFIRDFLQSQSAMGGGDEAEDVLGGLEAVNDLDWRSKERILYHIADAPCHGAAFHDPKVTDNCASKYEEEIYKYVLCGLYSKNIMYFFGRITHTTDMMIATFNKLVDSIFKISDNYIMQIPINASNVMSEIQSVITRKLVENGRDMDHIKGVEVAQQLMMEEVTGKAESDDDPSSIETLNTAFV